MRFLAGLAESFDVGGAYFPSASSSLPALRLRLVMSYSPTSDAVT
jgi:hypothetical protein